MNFFEAKANNLIERYQNHIIEDGRTPNNSEFVRRCLTRYGLPGAFQAYHRINERRALRQTGSLKTDKDKKDIKETLLTALFEYVVTPVESAAALIDQGPTIQKLNASLGAADWESGGFKAPSPAPAPKVTVAPAPKDYGKGWHGTEMSPEKWGKDFDANFPQDSQE